IRVDGQTDPLPNTSDYYVVMPTEPQPGDDLTITLKANFPTALAQSLYIEVQLQYGPGRGVARRPDSLHSVVFENVPSGNILYRSAGSPSAYLPMHVGWSALRSSF